MAERIRRAAGKALAQEGVWCAVKPNKPGKRERRFSLPDIYLPRPSLKWLLLPAMLLGLLALWYGWDALWNGLGALSL